MGKYFAIVEGEVLDWRYKAHDDTGSYLFYVGDILVGELSPMHCRSTKSWSAIGHGAVNGLRLVTGFRTRHDACEYLLRVTGLRKEHGE